MVVLKDLYWRFGVLTLAMPCMLPVGYMIFNVPTAYL